MKALTKFLVVFGYLIGKTAEWVIMPIWEIILIPYRIVKDIIKNTPELGVMIIIIAGTVFAILNAIKKHDLTVVFYWVGILVYWFGVWMYHMRKEDERERKEQEDAAMKYAIEKEKREQEWQKQREQIRKKEEELKTNKLTEQQTSL